jgi:hypothetical protein
MYVIETADGTPLVYVSEWWLGMLTGIYGMRIRRCSDGAVLAFTGSCESVGNGGRHKGPPTRSMRLGWIRESVRRWQGAP